MPNGFDFLTSEVLEWEIQAVWDAIDQNRLVFTDHADNEAYLDGLLPEDLLDAIALYDEVTKDLPGNVLRRAAGLNFDRRLGRRTLRVKVGWRGGYIVITAMLLQKGRVPWKNTLERMSSPLETGESSRSRTCPRCSTLGNRTFGRSRWTPLAA